jgi:P27 family predicted phage terminase small subunit
MARGGHNAKPTSLKLLQGTDRPDRLPANEPKPAPLTELQPPAGLDRYGRQCWRQYAPRLQQLGLLTEADALLLSALCGAYSRWRRSTAALLKVQPGDDDYRTLALTVEKAEHAMRLLANEFGMSPASRSRLDVSWKDDRADGADPMEDLLSGRRRA